LATDLENFISRASALEKRGMMAMFSSEFKALQRDLEKASLQLRTERMAAAKAGLRPPYCPSGKAGLSTSELLAHLRAFHLRSGRAWS
jgi:hypothetical protein